MEGRLREKKVEGEKKPTRYYSDKQEKQVASRLRGKQTSNSGATPFHPGDVEAGSALIECKTKMKDSSSITIHKEWIEKNRHEALFSGARFGVLAFNFGPNQKNYYILDEDVFAEFLEYLNSR